MRPAKVLCMCGVAHTLPRERVMDAIGVARWRCTDCRRRFVLMHEPPDTFTPVFLDPNVREGEVRETGSAAAKAATTQKLPPPPPAIEFKCRCGEPMTAHAWMYNSSAVCSKCRTTLFLTLKYSLKRSLHVIVPEYPAGV